MVIYPLSPEELDDKTLDEQIKAIAQTLCNMHHYFNAKDVPLKEFDFHKQYQVIWRQYLRECLANYKKLVDMGLACCEEWLYRFDPCHITVKESSFPFSNQQAKEFVYGDKIKDIQHKRHEVITWARDNVPDLPEIIHTATKDELVTNEKLKEWLDKPRRSTSFPLVMPGKFKKLTSYNPDNWNPPEHIDNVIYAYRKYYKAKLKKARQKELDVDLPATAAGDAVIQISAIKWARRPKPQWLGDL